MTSNTTENKTKFTETQLENFKNLVRKGIQLTKENTVYFNAVPNDVWARIFEVNFNGNYAYASRVILNQYKEIEKQDKARVDREKKKIHNLKEATDMFTSALDTRTPIIIITDFDNDGSLAQSIAQQYLKIDTPAKENVLVEYAQAVGGNTSRGLNLEHVELLIQHYGYSADDEFLIVTADNGINSREEQLRIEKAFPNCKIIITDHHNPDPDMVIKERKGKTLIFNPHYKSTDFFKQFNISGASTLSVLLQNVLEARYTPEKLEEHKSDIEVMDKICQVSNLLDYVNTDPADKPQKDYVVSRFLKLQPLLNVTNSITRLITDNIEDKTIEAIKNSIPNADIDLIYSEEKNIKIQNYMAKVLLNIVRAYYEAPEDVRDQLTGDDFFKSFAEKIVSLKDENLEEYVNTNFIEQLRPHIFTLSASDDNTQFLDEVNDAMQNVFKELRVSEKRISDELRKGEVVTRSRKEHSTIIYADPNILQSFTRKFLNKVYNDENKGFMLTLDSIKPARVSGSFRATYDISDILPSSSKKKLEAELNCKIETPGHERAAGFILTARDPLNHPITDKTIDTLNHYINESIADLKKKDKHAKKDYLLTDFTAIQLIDDINKIVRGNISNFEYIRPVLKIDENTVWTDPFTSDLHTMSEIVSNRNYGYVSLNINFSGDTIIVPTEILRRIVKNGYREYLSLDYMDGGVFMGSRVVEQKQAKSIIDLRNKNFKTEAIIKAWEETGLKNNPLVKLTREEIKDNPFFKYSEYGDLNFDLFEQMVIGVIDSNQVDTLAVFDVEAIGFANAKIINLGSMNYTIDENSGQKMNSEEFARKFFTNSRGESYLLTDLEIEELTAISYDQLQDLTPQQRKFLLTNSSRRITGVLDDEDEFFYIPSVLRSETGNTKLKKLPFSKINNYKVNDDGNEVIYNRTINAEMLAYLIYEDDFKIPAPMTSLTGIDINILKKYGKPTKEVDEHFSKYYESKTVLFGAHNIPYDGRIFTANLPLSYDMLCKNHIYDSALFARKEFLAYDNIEVTSLNPKLVNGATSPSGTPIYFYNNKYSDFNLTNFVLNADGARGVYPDRTGNYLLEIENGKFFMVDKINHKKIKLTFNEDFIKAKFQQLDDAEKELLFTEELFEQFEKDTGEEYEMTAKEIERMDTLGFLTSDTLANNPDLPIQTRALLSTFITSEMPGNAVKYSVEKLSEQYMIRSLLLFGENFNVNYVDLTKEEYAQLRPFAQELSFFQENYHFDIGLIENIFAFKDMFPNVESEITIKEAYYDADGEYVPSVTADLLEVLGNDFLTINKEIQEKFADAWIYKKVLEFYEPNPHSNEDDFRAHNKDMIRLVNFYTAIPEEKIVKIFDDAIAFKKHFKIDHIIQHESHVNGPVEGDVKGDIAFEDKLTFALLAERSYNSYNHNNANSIQKFNEFSLDASLAFDKSRYLTDLAVDSYSYRQALTYSREHQTHLIKKIQNFENQLELANKCSLVKFKLGNDVLPSKTSVVAITKPNTSLTREDIERDSEMLAFITLNEQIMSSLGDAGEKKKKDAKPKKKKKSEEEATETTETKEVVIAPNEVVADAQSNVFEKFVSMLESNREKSFEYKKELSKRYKFVDFSRADEQINNLLKDVLKFIETGDEEAFAKVKRPSDMDYKDYEIVETILDNYIKNAKRMGLDEDNSMAFKLKVAKQYLDVFKTHASTKFEEALITRNDGFDIADDIQYSPVDNKAIDEKEPHEGIFCERFLPTFKVRRLKPLNMIFEKHSSSRLLNNFVSDLMEQQEVSNYRPKRPKM